MLASCCARLVCRSEPFSILLPSSALFLALAFRPSALAFPGSPLAQSWRSTVISHFGIPWRSLAISRSGAQLLCISCSCALRRSALALSSGALWRSPAPGAIRRSAALVLSHSVVPRSDQSPHIVRCFRFRSTLDHFRILRQASLMLRHSSAWPRWPSALGCGARSPGRLACPVLCTLVLDCCAWPLMECSERDLSSALLLQRSPLPALHSDHLLWH